MSYMPDKTKTRPPVDAGTAAFAMVAKQALASYPEAVRGPVQFVTSSENHTYCVYSPQGRYALRIHRPQYHSRSEVEAELTWLSQLAAQGICVPAPVRGLDDRATQCVRQYGRTFLVALFPWMPGHEPNEAELMDTYPHIGRLLATLHIAARKAGPRLDRPCWDYPDLIVKSPWGSWRANPELSSADQAIIAAALTTIGERLRHHPRTGRNFGMIHADLRPTNVLLNGEELTPIDFDDCCYSWYLFDIAASLSFLEADPRLGDWLQALLKGYVSASPLTDADIALLPVFIMLRRIQLLAWMGSHRNSTYAQLLNPPLWVQASVELCRRFLAGALW